MRKDEFVSECDKMGREFHTEFPKVTYELVVNGVSQYGVPDDGYGVFVFATFEDARKLYGSSAMQNLVAYGIRKADFASVVKVIRYWDKGIVTVCYKD